MKNPSNDYRIIPLSNEILNDAVSLIETVFRYRPDQKNAKWSFTNSLLHHTSDKQYWLAVNHQGTIIGIIGLYEDYKENNSEEV